jgi:hypothetical protein
MALCLYCLKSEGDQSPWCPNNPGAGCQYGLGHEYPPSEDTKPKQPVRKVDKQLCTKCGLHIRNPASATNGCAHEYPE